MKTYEYKLVDTKQDTETFVNELNTLGALGFHIAPMDIIGYVIMEREQGEKAYQNANIEFKRISTEYVPPRYDNAQVPVVKSPDFPAIYSAIKEALDQ